MTDLPPDNDEERRQRKLARRAAWRAANREKLRAQYAAHYAANQEKARTQQAAYRTANREKRQALQRAIYANETPEQRQKRRVSHAAWIAANPESGRVDKQRRRARLAKVENKFTAADWRALVAVSKRCHWCRRPFTKTRKPTHDHVIPIAAGGANTPDNSVCACHECNSRKHAQLVNPVTGQGILI